MNIRDKRDKMKQKLFTYNDNTIKANDKQINLRLTISRNFLVYKFLSDLAQINFSGFLKITKNGLYIGSHATLASVAQTAHATLASVAVSTHATLRSVASTVYATLTSVA